VKVAGIDPGLYGAIAVRDREANTLQLWDMPTHNLGTAKAKKIKIDEVALANIFDDIAKQGVSEVWLEQVGSRPGEGHVGAFNFGRTYGLLRGLIRAHFFVLHDITPASWMASMGVKNVKGRKDHSRARASQLLPHHASHWPLVKHDGRAEASLIAEFGALRGRV
jgi:crossover junction endodeoxyribonuclease RuvC